eukprot:GEZU01022446.1.p1 GENE.GEZU01022446.1~~GEZU01022446.1.p1  ORF type:complete len:521 (+),score=144.48 GEZU01022446.1:71-1633(+)
MHNGEQIIARKWHVIPSLFEGRPSTILFMLPDQPVPENAEQVIVTSFVRDQMLYFKIPERVAEWDVIRLAFLRAGFKRVKGDNWNVMWGRHLKPNDFETLDGFQRINHFPGSSHLGRKDFLQRNLRAMKEEFGAEYDFFPESFILPDEADKLAQFIKNDKSTSLLIAKPPASSCGRNITIHHATLENIPKITMKKYQKADPNAPEEPADKSTFKGHVQRVVSKYIDNPLLINGTKFDLRLYVAMTSHDPIRLYLFHDGLTRLATQPYAGKKDLDNVMCHLTNFSINKRAQNFVWNTDENVDNHGNKWSIKALRRYFAENKIDDTQLWADIHDIIIKTILSVEHIIHQRYSILSAHRNACFELFGFDVLIDENMKPWLIEVNLLPSLSASSPLDKKIKTELVTNLFNMVGFIPYDRGNYEEHAAKKLHFQPSPNPIKLDDLPAEVRDFVSSLTKEQKLVLQETEDEYHRRDKFERIYPKFDVTEKYKKYFSAKRPLNKLVHDWLKLRAKYPQDMLFKAISQ